MKLAHSWLVAMALVLQVSALPVLAAQPTPPDVKADTKDKFIAVSDHVRGEMQAGGRFEFLTLEERDTVNHDLGDMQGLFDRFSVVDAMDDKSKIQLYNDQSEVNAILTRRDGQKEICTHELPTGSHLPKTTCRTYADMERNRRDTRKMQDDMLHTMIPAYATGKGGNPSGP